MKTLLTGRADGELIEGSLESAEAVLFSVPAEDDGSINEDAAGVWPLPGGGFVAAVADGMGGGPAGEDASATALGAVDRAVERAGATADALRAALVDAFEQANAALLEQGIGAGTTLVVVAVVDGQARAFHAGDSGALLVGQRGRVKLETVHHSPAGYAVASGLMERDALHTYAERHVLSNCVGSPDMRIEIGPPVPMAARDTLLLASDGVLDNVRHDALVEAMRKGPLGAAAIRIRDDARAAMRGEDPELPARPDDTTAVLLRRPSAGRGRR